MLRAVLIIVLLVGPVIATVWYVKTGRSEYQPPVATPRDPGWFLPLIEEDRAKPRFDQTINGITVGPTSSRRGGPCEGLSGTSAEVSSGPYDRDRAGQLRIEPKYLPAGTLTSDGVLLQGLVVCRGVPASTSRLFEVPADRSTGRFGGPIVIARYVGEPYALISEPAERFQPGLIGDRKAVFVKPITIDGLGKSAVVVAESFGLTVIEAQGLSLAEVVKVAEGLY